MEHETCNLTDSQWSLLQPIFPPPPRLKTSSRGRTAYSDRSILDAIFWVRRTASPWSALPPGYPSYLTCRRREIAWSRSGLLPRVLAILQDDLCQRGGIDLDRLVPDNLIAIEQRGSSLLLAVHPSLLDTWQLSTLMIFLAPPLKRTLRRRRLHIQFTPMPPSPAEHCAEMRSIYEPSRSTCERSEERSEVESEVESEAGREPALACLWQAGRGEGDEPSSPSVGAGFMPAQVP